MDVSDYRMLAKKRLPRFLFDYIDGGANSEQTLRANISDLQNMTLRQRVMRDVWTIDLSTHLMGEQLDLPQVLAPVGFAGFGARRGEVEAAQAAEAAGIRYRDYGSGVSGASGFRGIVLRGLQMTMRPRWVADVGVSGGPHQFGNLAPHMHEDSRVDDFVNWIAKNFDPSVTWSDFERIRRLWPGKLIVKGVLDPNDARSATERGADALIESNHGGRHLNVVKMLALGADAVMIGRTWTYALAANGREEHVDDLRAGDEGCVGADGLQQDFRYRSAPALPTTNEVNGTEPEM